MLVGDIGGTNTRLAVVKFDKNEKISNNSILAVKTYNSTKFKSLIDILEIFLADISLKIEFAIFAIAGPIIDGQCKLTNLNWIIKELEIKNKFNLININLINDLEALGYYISIMDPGDYITIQKGSEIYQKNKCIIAPGTGLGESFLTWNGENYLSHATEGGHTSFSPENNIQIQLLQYMLKSSNSRISVERLCSGIGINNIFKFLLSTGLKIDDKSLQEKIDNAIDPVPIIISTATERRGISQICDTTLEIFIQILGSECGNYALKTMALSGVYLGGGIPIKIQKSIKCSIFIDSFVNKGRMNSIMKKIPIYLIKNEKSNLFGAAQFGLVNFN